MQLLNYSTDKPIYLLFSGGKGSALAAYILKNQGYRNVRLLFTDTKSEDKDLYRFLYEVANFVQYPLVEFADGRDIWQVFKDNRFMGNTRIDVCSRELKREITHKFRAYFSPDEIIFGTGIDIWEEHRHTKALKYWEPYTLVAPLIDAGIYDKDQLWEEFHKVSGIKEPYLYTIGMHHNNCGGFCVKAGLAHYKQLLEKDRERYLQFEVKEQDVYESIGKRCPFLRKNVGGKLTYITLKEYRLMLETESDRDYDPDENQDFGGCQACMLVN